MSQTKSNSQNQTVEPIVSTISDEDLAELGIASEQARAFDRIIARSEREARDDDAWLDAMHD